MKEVYTQFIYICTHTNLPTERQTRQKRRMNDMVPAYGSRPSVRTPWYCFRIEAWNAGPVTAQTCTCARDCDGPPAGSAPHFVSAPITESESMSSLDLRMLSMSSIVCRSGVSSPPARFLKNESSQHHHEMFHKLSNYSPIYVGS